MRKKLFIAIDDTDEIGYPTSTGEICEDIRAYLKERYETGSAPITRHQLLLHKDIPYTSHNSSMCFTTYLSKSEKEDATRHILEYVERISAPSSDPGVCIAFEDEITDTKELISYGLSAKERVLTKSSAYEAAKKHNLFLRELGGSGLGVIGALAGVALRLYGNDGRVKGKFKTGEESLMVKDLIKELSIDEVREANGATLDKDAVVQTDGELKIVYQNHRLVLLVEKDGKLYRPLDKSELLKIRGV